MIITISKEDENQSVKKFVLRSFKDIPLSLFYKALRNKDIRLNNKRCKENDILHENDTLHIFLPQNILDNFNKNKDLFFTKAPKKVDITHEDHNFLIVDKSKGILTHTDDKFHFDNLTYRVLHYLYDKGEYNPDLQKSYTPSPVNRLDRNTSGLIIFAKNKEAHAFLAKMIKENKVEKHYKALVSGVVQKDSDTLVAYLYKDESKNKAIISITEKAGYKKIITKYDVIKRFDDKTLLDVNLITGRFHQIRAHLSFINHPLVDDDKYNNFIKDKGQKGRAQKLCCYKLIFNFTKEDTKNTDFDYMINMSFVSKIDINI